MAFAVDNEMMVRILEVGDPLEVTQEDGVKFITVVTEADMTWKGRRRMKKLFKDFILSGKRKLRVGKLVEVDEFILMKDCEEVYTKPYKNDPEISVEATEPIDVTKIYIPLNVFSARGILAGDSTRKFYKFI